MRNTLKYILTGIILFLAMVGYADASEATCTYTVGSQGDGKVECALSEDSDKPSCKVTSGNYTTGDKNYLINVNFQDTTNKKWKCPSKIYYSIGPGPGYTTTIINNFSTKESDSSQGLSQYHYVKEATLDATNSSDGQELESYVNTQKCVYGNLLLEIDKNNKTIKATNGGCDKINIDFIYDDFSEVRVSDKGCPQKLYMSINTWNETHCTYNLYNEANIMHEIKLDGSEPIIDGNGENVNDPTVDVPKDYVHGCDNIPETTAFIKKIYNLLKYLIPVMVIGLSIVDFVKVILSGEEKIYKEAWSKFVKRIVVGIIILILPVLLSFIINLSGVTENYGIDDNNIFCILK